MCQRVVLKCLCWFFTHLGPLESFQKTGKKLMRHYYLQSSVGNHRLTSLTLIQESSRLTWRISEITVFTWLILPSVAPGLEMTQLSKSPVPPCLICIAPSSCSDGNMWARVENGLKDGSVINSHQHDLVEKSCQMSSVLLFSEITSLADKDSCVYVMGFNICEAFKSVPHGILIKIISTIQN